MLYTKQIADLKKIFSEYSFLAGQDPRKIQRYFYWYAKFKAQAKVLPSKTTWDEYARKVNEENCLEEVRSRCPSGSGCRSAFNGWNNFIMVAERVVYGKIINPAYLHASSRDLSGKSEMVDLKELASQIVKELKGDPTQEDWKKALRAMGSIGKKKF